MVTSKKYSVFGFSSQYLYLNIYWTYATGTIGLGAACRTLNMNRGQLTLCGRVSAFIFGTGNHNL
ncbi:hypothetical protein LC605_10265 [Nostoc sp. CHAB 5836]|nr:hypothetical protein [Nostoc sp. CHAB 5836]